MPSVLKPSTNVDKVITMTTSCCFSQSYWPYILTTCFLFQNTIGAYIRMFEPLVIKSLKMYTLSSSVQLQVQVLNLLVQLIQLRVNYCLLDNDEVSNSHCQQQVTTLPISMSMNYDFIFLLTLHSIFPLPLPFSPIFTFSPPLFPPLPYSLLPYPSYRSPLPNLLSFHFPSPLSLHSPLFPSSPYLFLIICIHIFIISDYLCLLCNCTHYCFLGVSQLHIEANRRDK